MDFHENLGFDSHPFAKTNADEEPQLSRYFVPPPFFEAVVGDSRAPTASVILAPRGGGKTAQRRMVEQAALERRFLAVTYDRFEFSGSEGVANITLRYHLRNIIIRILVSYLSYLGDYPDLINQLDKQEKEQLSLFAHTYLGGLNGGAIQELLLELKSLPEKARVFWNKHVGILESVVGFLLKAKGLPTIDLPDIATEQKKLEATYKHQLEYLLGLIRKLGVASIYVLVDKPDETEQTGNNPEATYQLIRPMIRDLELLGLSGYGFKFFLWDKVEDYYKQDARPDRVQQYRLLWTREALQNVLTARLAAFSRGKIRTFQQLIQGDLGFNADAALALLANGSPRNLIRICEKIFAFQSSLDVRAGGITELAFEKGSLAYCEEVSVESYGEDIVRDLQRVGREVFTVNYLSNDVFKFTVNAARNKVTAWQNVGVITQIGTVTVATSGRPLNLYAVVDPSVVRLIYRGQPLRQMLEVRWKTCRSCNTDNLLDFSLLPTGNEGLCRECGRPLRT